MAEINPFEGRVGYIGGWLILILGGFYGLYKWVARRAPSSQWIEQQQKLVAEQIAVGDWEQALSLLEPLLESAPQDPGTLRLRIRLLVGMRKLARALEVAEYGLQIHPSAYILLWEKGRVLLELGKPVDALEALLRCQPILREEQGKLDLARALYLAGRPEDGWAQLKDFVLESCNGRLLALAGDCQFAMRNYPLAVSLYRQAQKFGWTNQRVLSRLGYSLHRMRNFVGASRCFRQILDHDQADVLATLGLGGCYEAQGLYERALLIYQSGLVWDQADPRVLRQAGICVSHLGNYAYAALYLSESLERGECSPQVLAFLGHALEQQRRWKDAEQVYLRLIEEFSEHVAGYRALAWMYGVGLTCEVSDAQGLELAEKSLQLQPDRSAWEVLSACEARAGNFSRAHDIQEHLSAQTSDSGELRRRRQAMRVLRQQLPLDEQLVLRTRVA